MKDKNTKMYPSTITGVSPNICIQNLKHESKLVKKKRGDSPKHQSETDITTLQTNKTERTNIQQSIKYYKKNSTQLFCKV